MAERPTTKQPETPVYHLKATPAELVGIVDAPDEQTAIERSIDEYAVSDLES